MMFIQDNAHHFRLTVRSCVNVLIAVLVLLGAGVSTALYWFHKSTTMFEVVKDEYYMESILDLVQIQEELLKLNNQLTRHFDEEAVEVQNYTDSESTDPRRRSLATSFYYVSDRVLDLRRREQQFGDGALSADLVRLEVAFDRWKSPLTNYADGPAFTSQPLERHVAHLSTVTDQLRRLHVIGLAELGARFDAWEARTVKTCVWVLGLLLVLSGITVIQLKRLIHSLLKKQDENEKALSLQVQQLDDSNKHRIKIHAELLDKTKALDKAKRQAESSNAAKSAFLANMSHEIRTPMTAILGFTDILRDNVTQPENLEATQTIKRNGEYLLALINDILDISKIEAGKIELERRDYSPQTLVADVASLMRVPAAEKGLSLEVRFEGPVPETIQCDPTRLRQVLINIVSNAIKFTETGSVQIVLRLLKEPGEEPKLKVDVIDTGIGIAEDQIEHIFFPFLQADNSTTRRFGGTGLGLAISKRLVDMLGGEITVSSTVGKGTTMSITVPTGPLEEVRLIQDPAELARETTKGKSAAVLEASLLDYRILLVEDGPDNQRFLSSVLGKAGAKVILAENGQVALDLATAAMREERPFDAILMDMQMPVMDGYTATGLIRQKGYTGPILALTAHAMEGDREKCIEAGCDDYLSKPLDWEKLIALLGQFAARESSAICNSAG